MQLSAKHTWSGTERNVNIMVNMSDGICCRKRGCFFCRLLKDSMICVLTREGIVSSFIFIFVILFDGKLEESRGRGEGLMKKINDVFMRR